MADEDTTLGSLVSGGLEGGLEDHVNEHAAKIGDKLNDKVTDRLDPINKKPVLWDAMLAPVRRCMPA